MTTLPSCPPATPTVRHRRRRYLGALAVAASGGAASLVGAGLVALPAGAVPAAGEPGVAPAPRVAQGPASDPATSRAPGPAFVRYCLPHAGHYVGSVSECDAAAYYNIDRSRHLEGYGKLALPRRFASSGLTAQLVAVTNAERRSRGLAALGESAPLNQRAGTGARTATDPTGPAGYTWVSTWAGGYRTPLAVDYGWMYDDGYGGTNTDCTAPGAPGCWAHRHDILVGFAGAIGGGQTTIGSTWSFAELLVQGYRS